MDTRILEGSSIEHVDLRVITVEGDFYQHNLPPEERTLAELLQPITDASHTRDRKRSPPDSACLPGTRKGVLKWIVSWVSSSVLAKSQHILWVYGHAGCGKSAIAQEVSEQIHGGGRLLATFFFCRNAGDRSKIGRLPNTIASQMTISLPETAPFIQAAAKGEPQLLQIESCFSFGARVQRLVYEPFKAFAARVSYAEYFLSSPYLIIIDGLDECDDKEGVQEFIATTLKFFAQNPYLPLRILITSRVEQHIHSCLTTDSGVRLKDLADCCTRKDIEMFMDTVFEAHIRSNPVIQAHIRQNGLWPDRASSERLVDHIGGSFIFASTLFKFIFRGSGSLDDHLTPLDRFPLALDIDPGLDGLYSQSLARSEHLPYFTNIISTVALLTTPLPISGIAELLDIQAAAVARVLVDLQAIIQVPGTDDAPVTFYHTSLRDFLTTKSRSERFFVPPSFHAHLLIRCLSCHLRAQRQTPKVRLEPAKQTAAARLSDLERLLHLRREMVELLPDDEKARGLNNVATLLRWIFELDGLTSTIEEAVSVQREALNLLPHPHPDRYALLSNLGSALKRLFEHNLCFAHIEEAISLHREALSLLPHSHPYRPCSLGDLGSALYMRFKEAGSVENLDEAISLRREALSYRLAPPYFLPSTLRGLIESLGCRYGKSRSPADLDEAIGYARELVVEHYLEGHKRRDLALEKLQSLLRLRFEATGNQDDLEEIEKWKEMSRK
ncbi:hypothetical protein EST38_g6295 [Candolleomyces aberdarensis]|uniref:Nephrocystin 3-like N-terminal domain-containing protein n=1 Tax=Candolleomyces aberdarensis TaxID=2316362 RepID=A0A4Q2DLC3_9AGAR|nr:hypothetical protein EST38_g6295 [Candolleomyces aberdarensis]